MDYKGKLYGKVAGRYLELEDTTYSVEACEFAIRKAAMEEARIAISTTLPILRHYHLQDIGHTFGLRVRDRGDDYVAKLHREKDGECEICNCLSRLEAVMKTMEATK